MKLLILASVCVIVVSAQDKRPQGSGSARGVLRSANQRLRIKSIHTSAEIITLPCFGTPCTPAVSREVDVSVEASDPRGGELTYAYSVTAGRVIGEGGRVQWDLGGTGPGLYKIAVKVTNKTGGAASGSALVTVAMCRDCVPPCPSISLSCPDAVNEGQQLQCTVNVLGGLPDLNPTFEWSTSGGNISSGQNTPSINIDTQGVADQRLTITVKVNGIDPACENEKSAIVQIQRASSSGYPITDLESITRSTTYLAPRARNLEQCGLAPL